MSFINSVQYKEGTKGLKVRRKYLVEGRREGQGRRDGGQVKAR